MTSRKKFPKLSILSATIVLVLPCLALASPGTSILAVTANVTTASIINTSQDDTVHSIQVGSVPYTAAFTPNGADIYVTNTGSGTVSVIRASTESVFDTINTGGSPYGVAVNPNTEMVYVTNQNSNAINVISTANNTITGTINVGITPYDVAFTDSGTQAYVTNSGSNTVSVIDTENGIVENTIAVGNSPEGLAFTPGGQYLFVTNAGDGTVSVIDTATGSVVKTIALGGSPSGISFNPSNNTAYVTNRANNSVQVINTATQSYTGQSIDVGSAPYNIVFGPSGHTAYAVNEDSDSVSVINTATGQVIRTINLNHSAPTGIAISPEGITGVYSASSEQQLVQDGFGANSSAYGNSINLDGGTLSLTAPFVVTNPIYLSEPIEILSSAAGGTIDNNGYPITLSGAISGLGGLTLIGNGIVTVTGQNTYSGGTVISGGEEIVSTDSNLGSSSGNVTLNGGELYASAPFSTGREIIINSPGGTIYGPVSESMDPSAPFALDLMGNFTGQGMLDTNGTVFYNGIGGPLGGVTVLGGLFEVGDANHPQAELYGPVFVDNGAVLRGHGTIMGNVSNDGTVFPGGSIGILKINGDYTQASNGTLAIEVTPRDETAGVDYDQLSVTGKALLAGKLAVQVDPGNYTVGEQYDIVHAAGGVSGQFTSEGYNPLFASYITPTLSYASQDVYLNLTATPKSFSTGSASVNNAYVVNQGIQNVLGSTLDGSQGIVDDSGNMHFTAAHVGVWAKGIGGFGRVQDSNVENYGGVMGYGKNISHNLILGGALSGMGTETGTTFQQVSGKTIGFYGYGIFTSGALRLSGSLGTGYLTLDSQRELQPTNLTASGSTKGWFFATGLQAQYLIPMGQAFFMPYGSVRYLHTGTEGFTEQGAGMLDITYGGQQSNLGVFTGGIRAGYNLRGTGLTWIPWVEVGGTGYAGNRTPGTLETIGLQQNVENALIAPTDAIDAGAGLTLKGSGPWTAKVAYSGQYSPLAHFNSFDLIANYRW